MQFNQILDFIKEHWEVSCMIMLNITSIITALKLGDKNKTKKKIIQILGILPALIVDSESLFQGTENSGKNKLYWVLDKIHTICIEESITFDKNYWTEKIEETLKTPQKK